VVRVGRTLHPPVERPEQQEQAHQRDERGAPPSRGAAAALRVVRVAVEPPLPTGRGQRHGVLSNHGDERFRKSRAAINRGRRVASERGAACLVASRKTTFRNVPGTFHAVPGHRVPKHEDKSIYIFLYCNS
jgi:hypothetical protein